MPSNTTAPRFDRFIGLFSPVNTLPDPFSTRPTASVLDSYFDPFSTADYVVSRHPGPVGTVSSCVTNFHALSNTAALIVYTLPAIPI